MGKRSKQPAMSFNDAMDLADTMDLPDGAFWAMAHDLADLEYGEGFDQLAGGPPPANLRRDYHSDFKSLEKAGFAIQQFSDHHFRINEICDWWPSSHKYNIQEKGKQQGKAKTYFRISELIKAIKADASIAKAGA